MTSFKGATVYVSRELCRTNLLIAYLVEVHISTAIDSFICFINWLIIYIKQYNW